MRNIDLCLVIWNEVAKITFNATDFETLKGVGLQSCAGTLRFGNSVSGT
jgi:hypothetical protein